MNTVIKTKEQLGVVIYKSNDGTTKIDVKLQYSTVWLTQSQIAQLFDKGRSTLLNI